MLHKKARPKRKINLLSTITTESKDCSNKNLYTILNKLNGKLSSLLLDIKYTSISNKFNNKLGLTLLNSIPVLSIFVLLGIIGFCTIGLSLGESDGEVYAETLNTNTSLIIDNGIATDSTATVRTGVTYSSHTVQVKAENITGYTLSITGPTNLSGGGTTISGAGGKQGSSLADNTWGYGWNTTSTTNANMTYNSFTGSAQTLSGDSVSNNSVNFTRKLVFAAKFNQNAVEGHYKANVTLNLTVSPKEITTFNGITKMQDMTADICKNAEIGDSTTLADTRDNNASSYLVRKLADGNCWMVDNLTLDLSKTNVATVAESDNLASPYPSTALINRFDTASTNAWENSESVAEFSKAPQKKNSSSGAYQPSYGYYYSFKAATAATISNDRADSGVATGSICPKGWHLPSTGDFDALWNRYTTTTWATINNLNGRWIGSAEASSGGAFFLAAGYVESSGLQNGGVAGYYRSRMTYDTINASLMDFTSSTIRPNNGFHYKYVGAPIRCVAYSEPDITKISTMQEMTKDFCGGTVVGTSKTLRDTRDGNSYNVRKLADGNCWMTTNLRLDLSQAGIATVAESDNLSSAYPTTALTNRWSTSTANAWQNDKTVAQFSKEPKKISSGSYQSGSGYFYSFKAATAATIADTATSGDASGSICPKGWKLPKGGSSGDFQALYNKYNNNQVSANKRILLGASTEAAGGTYFPAAGYVNSDGLNYGGTYGYYWSRTVYNADISYYLFFLSSGINPASYNYKYGGNSVRCVAYSS